MNKKLQTKNLAEIQIIIQSNFDCRREFR